MARIHITDEINYTRYRHAKWKIASTHTNSPLTLTSRMSLLAPLTLSIRRCSGLAFWKPCKYLSRAGLDCWRFYPDSGHAMVEWARHSGINVALLESYISHQHLDLWNDFVAVFIKDETRIEEHPDRILFSHHSFENGCMYAGEEIIKFEDTPEDIRRVREFATVMDSVHLDDASRGQQAQELRTQLEALQGQLAETNETISALMTSSGWKLTAPIRAVKQFFGG